MGKYFGNNFSGGSVTPMQIRLAKTEDAGRIKGLYKVLYRETSRLQPEFIRETEQDEEYLKFIILGENGDIILAEQDGQLLGFVMVQQRKTRYIGCLVPYRYAYLPDIVVVEEYRRQGIGKKLLRAAKVWAKNRGLEYVELNCLSGNVAAKALYQSEDFAECMCTMRTKL